MIRRTLSACSQVLTCADQHGDQQVREMMAEATTPQQATAAPPTSPTTSTWPSTTSTSPSGPDGLRQV
jgi:hypothetical protein